MREYRKRAKILLAMSHPVRLQILEILVRGPACVCELIGLTGKRQACVSQHLMLLRKSGLVKGARLGRNVQYELAEPEATKNMLKCLLQVSHCISANEGETCIPKPGNTFISDPDNYNVKKPDIVEA